MRFLLFKCLGFCIFISLPCTFYPFIRMPIWVFYDSNVWEFVSIFIYVPCPCTIPLLYVSWIPSILRANKKETGFSLYKPYLITKYIWGFHHSLCYWHLKQRGNHIMKLLLLTFAALLGWEKLDLQIYHFTIFILDIWTNSTMYMPSPVYHVKMQRKYVGRFVLFYLKLGISSFSSATSMLQVWILHQRCLWLLQNMCQSKV